MRRKARDVMTKPARCAPATEALGHALQTMRAADIRHLVVVDEDERVVGLVSERDLKRRMGTHYGTAMERPRDRLLMRAPLSAVMAAPETVAFDSPLSEAADRMRRAKLGAMPVVDSDGRPLGIITTTDLLRVLLDLLERGR